jgi:hypothetical protein
MPTDVEGGVVRSYLLIPAVAKKEFRRDKDLWYKKPGDITNNAAKKVEGRF